jgi:hypothetical protein
MYESYQKQAIVRVSGMSHRTSQVESVKEKIETGDEGRNIIPHYLSSIPDLISEY